VSVVRRYTRRRWLAVGGGVAVLVALPPVVAAWPVGAARADPRALRSRVLGSATVPYQGYVDSEGHLALPDLPQLGDVAGLLSGATSIRAWYAGPGAWRVAAIDSLGERDIYRTADGTFLWDFQRNQATLITGEVPVRLPWASDVVPPALARRLLAGAATGDRYDALPARRVAGVAATGLRMRPSDPDTTIGRVDVWADPATGLPLDVEVAGRVTGTAIFTSRFLDFSRTAPDPATLTPTRPPSAGFDVTSQPDVAAAVNAAVPVRLPDSLAGRARVPTPGGVRGVGGYGAGLSSFVVVPLPGRLGAQIFDTFNGGGATPVLLAGGDGFELSNSVLTALAIRRHGGGRRFLLTGFVTGDLLRRAATDLLDQAHE
jgi:hypothetical protein